MAGGGGPMDWGIFLPWLSLILSRLSHYYSFEYVISRSNHSTNLDFHFSFYQKPTFGIWGFLNYFDTLFAMSLKPFAETIALTKKQCLESATNVLFLLSDAITVKYCLCQWQIIALRAALFYFISRAPSPPSSSIFLWSLPGIISATRGNHLIFAIMEFKSSVNFLKRRFSPENVKKGPFCFASSLCMPRGNFLLPKLLHPLCTLKLIVGWLIISSSEKKLLTAQCCKLLPVWDVFKLLTFTTMSMSFCATNKAPLKILLA